MKFSRTRKRLTIATLIVAAVVGISFWMRPPGEFNFFVILTQHPSLQRAVRPMFWAVGCERYFDREIWNNIVVETLEDGENVPLILFEPVEALKSPLSVFWSDPSQK